MDSETQEIIDYFLTESRESVAEVEPLLIELESEGGTPDKATIDSIFRLFHSMKGSAGFLEFTFVEGVTHHAETLLDMVRKGNLAFSADLVDLLCRALDFTNQALDIIEASQSDADMAEPAAAMISRMEAAAAGKPVPASKPAASVAPAGESRSTPVAAPAPKVEPKAPPVFFEPPPPEEPIVVDASEREADFSGGMVAVFGDPVVDLDLDDDTESEPEVVTPPSRRAAPAPAAAAPVSADEIRNRLGQILIDGGYISEHQLQAALGDPTLPVGQKLVKDGLVDPATVRTALDIQERRRNGEDPSGPAAGAAIAAAKAPDPNQRRKSEFLRVDVRKLDQLMDLIGELIIAETAVTHGPGNTSQMDGQHKAAVQLNRVTRGLQDVAMSLRMVPIDPTFKKMVRLVRDLSKRQGKRVQLEITGEDTEVDKSVVEAISDPLVHLIRNSIDHGIESEAERVKKGKPPEGRVTLCARQQAGEIRIIVQDDGRGLDRSRILAKAQERGLVRGDGADMADADVFKLIFEAGFSTAAQVTDISGRGVGMDVVKQNIESVKGRVDIASTLGKGTTITLRIPLTLAIIEGMLVRVGETRFTIPMLSILETVVVHSKDITALTTGQEVVKIRGQLLPVFRVHDFYNIKPDSTRIEEGLLVVVEDGKDRLCLLVDELVGQRQTVIKALSGYLGNVRGLAGCTVLGDGAISLIIDVAKLIQDTRESSAA